MMAVAVAVIVEISVTVSDVEEMVEEVVGIQVEGTQRQELSEGSMPGPLEPPLLITSHLTSGRSSL